MKDHRSSGGKDQKNYLSTPKVKGRRYVKDVDTDGDFGSPSLCLYLFSLFLREGTGTLVSRRPVSPKDRES